MSGCQHSKCSPFMPAAPSPKQNKKVAFRRSAAMHNPLLLALLASSTSLSLAQSCISLAGSTTCPAFNASSVSTDAYLVGLL